MNFGQPWRTAGIVDVEYCAELPRAFVMDVLRELVPDFIDDSRKYPDPESEIDRALATAGWPDVDWVLTNSDLTRRLVEFFAYDALLWRFGDRVAEDADALVLNTVESVSVADDSVVIRGQARRTDTAVLPQDM